VTGARAARSAATLARALLLLLAGTLAAPAGADTAALEAEALRAMDAFMAAFNARDVEAWAATLNFPHVRIASGKVAVFEDAAAFRSSFEFAQFAQQTGWSRSEWTDRRVIQAGPDKVHVAVVFTRFRADGSVLAKFESLYVVTKLDGHWGVQARSSYAP
jgi:hypothetical protein